MKVFAVFLTMMVSVSAFANCPLNQDEAFVSGVVLESRPHGDLCQAKIAFIGAESFSPNYDCPIYKVEVRDQWIDMNCEEAVPQMKVDGMLYRAAGSTQLVLDN